MLNRGGSRLVGRGGSQSVVVICHSTWGGATHVSFYLHTGSYWPAANTSVFTLTLVPM